MPQTNQLRQIVKDEITQRAEEGCDLTGFEGKLQSARTEAELMRLYNILQELPVRADFPYVEPSDLAQIRAHRPGKSAEWKVAVDEALFNRLHGAWLGRIAGCMLGKAVEGWTRDSIRDCLISLGEYPLTNYIPSAPDAAALKPYKPFTRGAWDHAMSDDDTNYTVLALKTMELKGPEFTTADVGYMWHENLPINHVYTAERQAYLNLANGIPIDQVPLVLNPCREWIGAQIRADFWGYCAPGKPEVAAEFAHRDASFSHVKNGIYGEMFCAAMVSSALATDDLIEIISAALNEIPSSSRLAETVSDCMRCRADCATWEEAYERMKQTYYGQYGWVHTNNNLAIVLIALLFGWPDYEKVISYAVMQGMDTDCNGATAGSVLGAAIGAKRIPSKWIAPLGGRLDTPIPGFACPEIDVLARRTTSQVEKVGCWIHR